jgi:general stress protein 26
MEPRRSRPNIPAEYGRPKGKSFVEWSHVEERLAKDRVYWVASVTAEGRPHVRPVDGLYVDGRLWVGGSPKTRWVQSLAGNKAVTVHLDGVDDLVIVEGDAETVTDIDDGLARRLADESNAKFGYGMTPDSYKQGAIAIRPRKIIAWTNFMADPTRFTFEADR